MDLPARLGTASYEEPAVTDVRPYAVVVLAAGEGKRMRSATPKVLHAVAGRTLLGHVLSAAGELQPEHLAVVVGHGRDAVRTALGELAPAARVVVQEEQRGTGHALRLALQALPDGDGVVVVLAGDTPLLRGESLRELVGVHVAGAAATTLLTARVPDATGYGRVVRDPAGAVRRVVEHRDADEPTRRIDEIATGVYAFEAGALRAAITRLRTDNDQGEEYLPDVVALHCEEGLPVAGHLVSDPDEARGVNDRVQLAEVARLLRDRIVRAHQLAGVAVLDPATTWIDADVVLEPDVSVLPNTSLHAGTVVRAGASVGPDTSLTATTVGAGAQVTRSQCSGAVVGPGATVGPYSFLRPGAVLGAGAKVGAFVEVKGSEIGDGAKVPHLSYVGDATIGARSNIGAGTIVANYDGVAKHRTRIGADVRVGSNNTLVAPLDLDDGCYTAGGSTVTQDVPSGALAVGRARQRTIEGWVARRRHLADKGESSA